MWGVTVMGYIAPTLSIPTLLAASHHSLLAAQSARLSIVGRLRSDGRLCSDFLQLILPKIGGCVRNGITLNVRARSLNLGVCAAAVMHDISLSPRTVFDVS